MGGHVMELEVNKIAQYQKFIYYNIMPLDLNGNKLLSTSIGSKSEVIKSIVTDGLICHLDAGNKNSYTGSGTTWTDLSGNGYNATLFNGVGYNSNGYLTFDGSNDYATTASVPNYKSISVWAYLDAKNSYFLDERTGSPDGYIWFSGIGSDWNQFYINGSSVSVSPTPFPTGQWFHFYARNTALRTGTITLFSRYTVGEFNPGRWSIFKFYNRDLSDSEIKQDYNAQKSRFGL
jgi:hypothetical protein